MNRVLTLCIPALFALPMILPAQDPIPPPLPVDSSGDMSSPPLSAEMNDGSWTGEGSGISGVYEVAIGVDDLDEALKYWARFGFRLTKTGYLNRLAAEALYGVPSALKAYRLQNGKSDSHGMVRLWVWDEPSGPGVGYAPPGTVGQRLVAQLTTDVIHLEDIYRDARDGGEPWLVKGPVRQGVLGDDRGPFSFFEPAVTTRELAVYGPRVNHLFYQRYGYTIPGFGNIHNATPLGTSEITHHDFFIRLDSIDQLQYLVDVLGLVADGEPVLEGDWLRGPRQLYGLRPGDTYRYQTFHSPNNICGKLRFFIPFHPPSNRSDRQRPGFGGITAHTFYSPRMDEIWTRAADASLNPTPVMPNEFGERCFTFRGPEGNTWQIIEKREEPLNEPIPVFHLQMLDE